MEDREIVELYHRRDEAAIGETDRKHGSFCRRLAGNLLSDNRDAEECVSDTYLAAWNRMPPDRPDSLRAFLGRIVRNISISRFRRNRAEKRYAGMEAMLSELDHCVPEGAEDIDLDRQVIADTVSRWLDTLSKADRILFVRRYWYGDQVKELAERTGVTPNEMARRMQKLRAGLRDALAREGVEI